MPNENENNMNLDPKELNLDELGQVSGGAGGGMQRAKELVDGMKAAGQWGRVCDCYYNFHLPVSNSTFQSLLAICSIQSGLSSEIMGYLNEVEQLLNAHY